MRKYKDEANKAVSLLDVPKFEIALLALISGAVGYQLNNMAEYFTDPDFHRVRDAFDKAAELHVSPPSREVMARGAISGMMKTLDPYSTLITKQTAAAFDLSRRKDRIGIGIAVNKHESGNMRIVEAVMNAPAARAGIQANDLITRINGMTVKDTGYKQSFNMLKGKEGVAVELTVRRGEKTLNFNVRRERISGSSVKYQVMDGNIGYLRLDRFRDESAKDMENAVNALKTELNNKNAHYILDLRGNGGGLLNEATDIVDLFIDQRAIITSMSNSRYTHKTEPGDILNGAPLTVLTDEGSASASELISGALQHYDRAKILGRQTYGKGTAQSTYEIGKGDSLRITRGYYYLPSGASIQKIGVTPDIRYDPAPYEENDTLREAKRRNALPNPQPGAYNIKSTYSCRLREDIDITSLSAQFFYRNGDNKAGQIDGFKACAVDMIRNRQDYTHRKTLAPET